MKKKLSSWLQLVILFLGIVVPSFSSISPVEAKEVAGVITSMSLSNHDGAPLGPGYDIWQQFRINATFALPNNTVSAGDTTTITLPPALAFAVTTSIELKDSNDNVVANATLDGDAKTITLTYTNYAESHSNVTGNFFFYGRVDHNVIQNEQDIDVTLNVQGAPINAGKIHYNGPPGQYSSLLEKAGWQDDTDVNRMKYELAINRNMDNLANLVIKDKILSPGLELIPNSFQVYRLDWSWNNGTWDHTNHEDITSQLNIQIAPDNRSFSIDLGSLNHKGILINYDVRLPYTPVDGEVFENEAELKSNDRVIGGDLQATTYFVAGGSAEGYVFSIDITKTDEGGQPLSGAVFEVVRNRNGAVVNTLTTDNSGKAVFTGLLKDEYTIREVTPPPGYKPLTDTIAITPDDFGTTKVASRTVVNKKEEQPKKITFSKVNLGGSEVAGAEIEIYKGNAIAGNPVAKWTSTTTPKELDLAPGTYVFHEKAAPNGLLKVTDITFEVKDNGTVEVTNIGQQDAKGENNQVVTAGSKITITDKTDDLPRKITFSKVNLGGDEVAGAEVEIYKGNTVAGTPVHKWTSGTTPKELDLAPGTYVFHEKAAPNGLLKVTDITFKVNYDSTVVVTNIGEKDAKGEQNQVVTAGSKITITDKTDDTPRKVIFRKTNKEGQEIGGATIQIFKGTDLTAQPVAEWTTVAGKEHEIQLAPGEYTFHEASAPAGFHAVSDFTFRVNHDGTSEIIDSNGNNAYIDNGGCTIVAVDPYDESPKKITFSKVNLGGEEIAGAKIQIFDEQKNQVAEWTSEAGKSKIIDLKPGKYVFHEEAAPNGYVAVTDITFQVNYDGTVTVLETNSNAVEYKDGKLVITDQYDESPKKITFSKVNLGGDEVEGAEVEIYKGDTITGAPVEKWTSGTTPKELNLAPGTYVFHEEAAPEGLLKVTDITFKVNYDGTVTVTNIGEKDAKGESNTVVTDGAKITITDKTDDLPRKITFSKVNLGGDEVEGAEVEIYAGDTVTGTPVEKWTSGTTPKELNLAPGTYVFHEEAAPEGLLKVTDITFKVNYDGTVTVTNIGEKDAKGESNTVVTDGAKITITDKTDDLPRKITFSKVNLGGEEIAGAKIQIFDEQKNQVAEWTSEAGKSKIIDLKPGKYVFHEEAAPNGYLAVTDITFQVNYDGTITVTNIGEKDAKGESNTVVTDGAKITITDKTDDLPRKITFSKVNLGGEEIAGAKIQIFDEQKNKVAEWTSEAGKSKIIDLKPGKYVFHEEAAPNGYLAVTDITFQVNYDGTVTVLDTNSNAVEYKDGKLVITDQYAPTTTTETPNPPSPGKKRKALPKTGEESGLTTTLIGFTLLVVVGAASVLYRKSKESE